MSPRHTWSQWVADDKTSWVGGRSWPIANDQTWVKLHWPRLTWASLIIGDASIAIVATKVGRRPTSSSAKSINPENEHYTDVSENSGTPKSSILIGFSIINHPFWGTPIFGNTHTVRQQGASFIYQLQFQLLRCDDWIRHSFWTTKRSIIQRGRRWIGHIYPHQCARAQGPLYHLCTIYLYKSLPVTVSLHTRFLSHIMDLE